MDQIVDSALEFARTQGAMTIALQTIILLFVRQLIVSLPSKKGRTEEKRAKFGESLWFFIYYTASFSIGITYLWDKEWLWDPRQYWLGGAMIIPEFPMGLQLIYTTQTAFYIAASIVVLFLSHARANHKDKLIMLAHHFVTITLLAVSYAFGQHRIGSVVLILHDVSDIFLEGAKICRYCGWEFITNQIFATFAVVFFISRLVILPLRVLYPIVVYFPHNVNYYVQQCTPEGACAQVSLFSFNTATFWLALLGTLQCLHLYWFALIFRMVVRAIRAKHVEKDIRSDDEEEVDTETEKESTNNGKKKRKVD